VCSKPIEVGEKILKQVDHRLKESPKFMFLIIRFCELLGCLAIKLLGYLDNNVYRELKRRNYLREERKKTTKNKKNKRNSRTRRSLLNTTSMSESSAVSTN
jgi:hypothetical protein